jgi:hypothetical protein
LDAGGWHLERRVVWFVEQGPLAKLNWLLDVAKPDLAHVLRNAIVKDHAINALVAIDYDFDLAFSLWPALERFTQDQRRLAHLRNTQSTPSDPKAKMHRR